MRIQAAAYPTLDHPNTPPFGEGESWGVVSKDAKLVHGATDGADQKAAG
jgi:hypothetical protein